MWKEDFCTKSQRLCYIRTDIHKLQTVELSLNFSLEAAEIQPLFLWCVFVHLCIGTEKGRIQKVCKLANTECANHWTQLQCLLDEVGKKPELKVMMWTASPHYFQSNWFCCSHYITLDLKRKKKKEVVCHLSLLMDRNESKFMLSMWDKWTKFKMLCHSLYLTNDGTTYAQLSCQHSYLLPVWGTTGLCTCLKWLLRIRLAWR